MQKEKKDGLAVDNKKRLVIDKEDMMWESKTKFWRVYRNMVNRCTKPNSSYYYLYWGRWIKCEWDSYKSFRNDMYDSYLEHCAKYWEKETTIDRINSDGNYCKENCRWATCVEQWRNTKRNHRFQWKWGNYTLKEIYDMENVNIAYKTFAWRVYHRWWTIEDAINIPFINQEHRYDRKWGKYLLKEIYDMEKPDVCYGTFISRIYQSKWSIEDAVKTSIVKGFWNKLLYSNREHND